MRSMRERERHRTGAGRERCGVSARAPRLWSEWMVVYSVKTLVLEYVYYTSDLISNGIRGIRIHHLGLHAGLRLRPVGGLSMERLICSML